MITWHKQGDEPHIKLIDCDMWTIFNANLSYTVLIEKNIYDLVQLVMAIWSLEMRRESGATFSMKTLIRFQQLDPDRAADILQAQCAALFPQITSRLVFSIKKTLRLLKLQDDAK